MKVRYLKILLLTMAGIGLSAGLLFAAKPSLSAAKSATTIGDLLKVIRTASGKGDFFVYNVTQRRYTSHKSIGLQETPAFLATAVGELHQDLGQIEQIKNALVHTSSYKRASAKQKKNCLGWVDHYANYLLYFVYDNNGTPVKVYINDPWPQATLIAVSNIIKKWAQ
jgi:hypothetical protein